MRFMDGPWRAIEVQRVRDGQCVAAEDRAATEAPLAIRLHGQHFVMTMRTPGADRDLAAGFLLSEQVVRGADEIAAMAQADDESAIDVTLAGQALGRLDARMAERRHVTTSSACGICGRQTVDALVTHAAPITATWTIPADTLSSLPERLRAGQAVFDETGGVHAAGLFGARRRAHHVSGGCRPPQRRGQSRRADAARGAAARGHAARRQRPRVVRDRPEGAHRGHAAHRRRLGSLEAGDRLRGAWRLTLAAFVRDERFNVYTHERIA